MILNSRLKELPNKSLKSISKGLIDSAASMTNIQDGEKTELTTIALIISCQAIDKTRNHDTKWHFATMNKIISYLEIDGYSTKWDNSFFDEILKHKDYWGYIVDYIYQCILENKKNKGYVTSHRKKQGAYFTPYPIAYYIVKETLLSSHISPGTKILDPAVGTGTFVSAVAHYLYKEKSLSPSEISNIIHGYDKDEIAIKISSLILASELNIGFDFIDNKTTPYKSYCIDFLTASTPSPCQRSLPFEMDTSASVNTIYDFVVMNPPYDRLKSDSESTEEKENTRLYIKNLIKSSQYKEINGSIDLYRLFLEKCMYVTRSNGRIGAIIPRTFLADKSARSLRASIVNSKALDKVLLIPEKLRTFDGVTQAFCIVIIDKISSKEHFSVGCSETKFPNDNQWFDTIPYQLASNAFPGHNYIAIIDHVGYELIKHLNTYPKISSIPFISNKRGELDLTLYSTFIGTGEGKLLRGKHVQEFEITGHDNADTNKFTEKIIRSTKVLDINEERIVCQQISNNDSSKRMKFAYTGPGVVLGNSLNYIKITNKIPSYDWDIFALLGIMNSIILDWRFNVTSSNNHVNNYEIDDLPFPIQFNKGLIRKIGNISKSISFNKTKNDEMRSTLEMLVLEAYDAIKFSSYLREHHPLGTYIRS